MQPCAGASAASTAARTPALLATGSACGSGGWPRVDARRGGSARGADRAFLYVAVALRPRRARYNRSVASRLVAGQALERRNKTLAARLTKIERAFAQL